MEDSGAILCQISSLKDMLDQVYSFLSLLVLLIARAPLATSLATIDLFCPDSWSIFWSVLGERWNWSQHSDHPRDWIGDRQMLRDRDRFGSQRIGTNKDALRFALWNRWIRHRHRYCNFDFWKKEKNSLLVFDVLVFCCHVSCANALVYNKSRFTINFHNGWCIVVLGK